MLCLTARRGVTIYIGENSIELKSFDKTKLNFLMRIGNETSMIPLGIGGSVWISGGNVKFYGFSEQGTPRLAFDHPGHIQITRSNAGKRK